MKYSASRFRNGEGVEDGTSLRRAELSALPSRLELFELQDFLRVSVEG